MKPIRNILLAGVLTLVVCVAVVYTACNKDHCTNVVCQNGGACDGGNCTCLPGFEDARCATLSRTKFIYVFNGGDTCSNNDSDYIQYPVQFITVATNPREMTMNGILNSPADSALCTMQSPDSFSFIGSNNATSYTGSGTWRNDTLKLIYHVQHDTVSYDCAYIGGLGH